METVGESSIPQKRRHSSNESEPPTAPILKKFKQPTTTSSQKPSSNINNIASNTQAGFLGPTTSAEEPASLGDPPVNGQAGPTTTTFTLANQPPSFSETSPNAQAGFLGPTTSAEEPPSLSEPPVNGQAGPTTTTFTLANQPPSFSETSPNAQAGFLGPTTSAEEPPSLSEPPVNGQAGPTTTTFTLANQPPSFSETSPNAQAGFLGPTTSAEEPPSLGEPPVKNGRNKRQRSTDSLDSHCARKRLKCKRRESVFAFKCKRRVLAFASRRYRQRKMWRNRKRISAESPPVVPPNMESISVQTKHSAMAWNPESISTPTVAFPHRGQSEEPFQSQPKGHFSMDCDFGSNSTPMTSAHFPTHGVSQEPVPSWTPTVAFPDWGQSAISTPPTAYPAASWTPPLQHSPARRQSEGSFYSSISTSATSAHFPTRSVSPEPAHSWTPTVAFPDWGQSAISTPPTAYPAASWTPPLQHSPARRQSEGSFYSSISTSATSAHFPTRSVSPEPAHSWTPTVAFPDWGQSAISTPPTAYPAASWTPPLQHSPARRQSEGSFYSSISTSATSAHFPSRGQSAGVFHSEGPKAHHSSMDSESASTSASFPTRGVSQDPIAVNSQGSNAYSSMDWDPSTPPVTCFPSHGLGQNREAADWPSPLPFPGRGQSPGPSHSEEPKTHLSSMDCGSESVSTPMTPADFPSRGVSPDPVSGEMPSFSFPTQGQSQEPVPDQSRGPYNSQAADNSYQESGTFDGATKDEFGWSDFGQQRPYPPTRPAAPDRQRRNKLPTETLATSYKGRPRRPAATNDLQVNRFFVEMLPILKPLQGAIRTFTHQLLLVHHPQDEPFELTSITQAQARKYELSKNKEDGPNIDQLALDFTGEGVKTTWNKRAAELFAEKFAASDDNYNVTDLTLPKERNSFIKRVRKLFLTHLQHLRNQYQKSHSLDPMARQDAKDKQKSSNRYQRRYLLYHRRKAAFYDFDKLKTRSNWAEIWDTLNADAMSGDETDHESPHEQNIIKRLKWRNRKVDAWLRGFDKLHLFSRFDAADKPTRGKFPTPRIPSNRVQQDSSKVVVGLPRNFYDEAFLTSLGPTAYQNLEIKEDVDLTFTTDMLWYDKKVPGRGAQKVETTTTQRPSRR
ncbi:hypothetical protein H0H93_013863 [Arthromyces matolae]|nr:hypothetical protein H0H93_013863 [Arthromyces matolae]